jgi:hypothetical protein
MHESAPLQGTVSGMRLDPKLQRDVPWRCPRGIRAQYHGAGAVRAVLGIDSLQPSPLLRETGGVDSFHASTGIYYRLDCFGYHDRGMDGPFGAVNPEVNPSCDLQ